MKNNTIVEIEKIIKEAKREGISLSALARQAHFGRETLRRWRVGINRPLYENFKRLEEAFIYLTNKPK